MASLITFHFSPPPPPPPPPPSSGDVLTVRYR
jgi:hypothetical protein